MLHEFLRGSSPHSPGDDYDYDDYQRSGYDDYGNLGVA